MKLVFITLLAVCLASCQTKSSITAENNETSQPIDDSSYDSLLSESVGADPYGMRKYVIAYLLEGPNRDQDSATAAALQTAHLKNITAMAEAGKLVLAGPFMDDQEVKGIYVFAVETIEEAEELTKTDPSIKAGRLVMELHPWYGSAALMQVNEIHKKIAKESF